MAKDKYTNDTPNERGFYWIMDDVELPTIVYVTKRVKGSRKVMNFDRQFYDLKEFGEKFVGLLWYGPLDEPERNR